MRFPQATDPKHLDRRLSLHGNGQAGATPGGGLYSLCSLAPLAPAYNE